MEVCSVFFSFLNFSSFPFDFIEVRMSLISGNREQKPDISFLKKSKKVREQPCAYEVLRKKAIVVVTISLCWYIRSKLSVSSCCMIGRFSGTYFTVRPT